MPRVARANVDAAGRGPQGGDPGRGRRWTRCAALEDEAGRPFDFVFIDADKENNPQYLEWAVRLGRPGTTIVMDNVVWEGAVLDPSMDPKSMPRESSAR